jgi:hypothetical protein
LESFVTFLIGGVGMARRRIAAKRAVGLRAHIEARPVNRQTLL